MRKSTLIKSVGIVTLATVIGKLLGFGREAFIAAYFGTSYEADVYYVASVIPNILFAALGTAITTGMIPLYIENKQKDLKQANEQAGVIATIFILFSLFITFLCYLLTPELIHLIAPGFTQNEKYFQLTITLTQIMLPISVFLVLTSLAQGILNANKKFLAPALVTIPHNLIIILSIILFAKEYGIYGVAIGTLIGGISQFLIQYPSLKNYKIKLNLRFKKHKVYIVENLKIFIPIIITGVSFQFIEVFNRIFASFLDEGSISALNYSMKLLYLPLSVLLMSIITVLFPNLVESANKSLKLFLNNLWKGFITIALITIPIAVIMILDSENIVSIIFERGEFDSNDTIKTAYSFVFYSIGLIFIATREYLSRCFIALKKSKVLMYTTLIAMIFNIVTSYILLHFLAHGGIALGTSLSFVLQTVILFVILHKILEVTKEEILKFSKDLLKLFVLALSLIIFGYLLKTFWINIDNKILETAVFSSIIFSLFFITAYLLKFKELSNLINMFIKKFSHRKKT